MRWWWMKRRARRECFHGEPRTSTSAGESWVRGQLIDLGRRKLWWCGECGRRWVT